ncbi:endolytic transglycosylase MltG [Patescibacteria group bacterium]|nr:endolytic transglycosylase MltG [Patescibacteria group bacterium]MBU1472325.1 endolytic transglycosylase MltG [Patescibacteria group bacterium]MBU2460423.1 endolytic transglycosylase MltG [Patescibacteria group bacterium]MBU2544242.1 endolytic transglycosylase MltG [Patescibacteria group bacterium]
MKLLRKILTVVVVEIILLTAVLWWLLGPVAGKSQPQIWTVPEDPRGFDAVQALKEQQLIRSAPAFRLLMAVSGKDKAVAPGGYRLDRRMNARQVLQKIGETPDLLWVTISGCRRREEIAEMIDQVLGWSQEKIRQWNEAYTKLGDEYKEGVYYPDTYLLPTDESGAQIAERFIDHFNEKFSPLSDDFAKANIKWTTGLKIASLIAREAAGPQDMALISGIIWNRLNQGMKLEIDATMQYTLGKHAAGGWWGGIDLSEKRSSSPYNTYIYKGLPPTPICSPGIEAIRAALTPQETDCLYYLHDRNRQIHCGRTYEEHKVNIRTYLM